MNIVQTRRFSQSVKKLHKNQKQQLDEAVKAVLANPNIGEAKVGDLNGIYVYKFRINNQLALMAYEFSDTNLILIALGSHENFYRDLKN